MIEVTIDAEHLRVLEELAQAASDLRMGKHESEFAALNGGYERLESDLFEKVAAWESYMCSISDDSSLT